ncbi:hypothetical protein B9G69_004250 [Bdellovibrio sp. SKB1291214]|uniref:hypothetical protein n=1 Tax=Bdellovibrio sp. SKB1291214 TaxID=1732569 RepID=UPI000B51C6A5|nr:hypothetical protein [Bdellovibrio sp. SKB1291214]UYL09785.1 hypothetical protein B9G69_004250 [Bdellovibrio sp. SKB1291214]
MRTLMAMISLIFICSSAYADKQFQMTHAPGVWRAEDSSGIFNDFHLNITPAEDGSLNIQHCTTEIENTGVCTAYDQASGLGEYVTSKNYIQVYETNSHTWEYTLTIDDKNPKMLYRVFGTQIIRYFKL